MRQRNSLGIFLRTLLLLAMLFVVGCRGKSPDTPVETDELASAVPSPDDTVATPRPMPTSTPPWPTPEIISVATSTPTPTPTPDPGNTAGSSTRRIIFVLDHSNSVVNDCFSYPQEPAHSEARRAMRDMVVFMVDLLGELERAATGHAGAPPITIEVGVYTLHPYADPWAARPQRELLAVQDVAMLRAGWDEPMVALLDAFKLDAYGWDIGWLDGTIGNDPLPSILAQNDDARNMVILLTDGYTGQPTSAEATPTRPASELRRELSTQLDALHALPGALDFNVVRFNCPNLAGPLGTPPADYPDIYNVDELSRNDAGMWQELAERQEDSDHGVWLYIQDLPRSAATQTPTRYDSPAYWRSFAPVVQNLLAQLEISALWPLVAQTEQYGLAGYGWLQPTEPAIVGAPASCAPTAAAARLPTRDTPACLPGNTATFALRLVAAPAQPGSYSVFFRRGDQTFRRALHDVNADQVYTIDPEDHVLRDVLATDGELCGPIEWWIEGPDSVSFFWWATQPARYSLGVALEEETVENNGSIVVNYEVEEEVAEPGNADCYAVRVRLSPTKGTGELVQTIPLRKLYPDLRDASTFENYPFTPRDHGQLVVNVDLIEGLNREAGDLGHRPGDPAQQVVVDTFEEMGVTSVFVPQFDGYTVPVHSCGPDEGECNVTVIFHFANSAYFSGEIPPPVEQVFALNAFTGDELSNDTQVFKKDTPCDGLMPNEKLPPQALDGQQKLNSTEDDFASGLSRTEDSDRFAYEDSDSSRREFSLPLFTPEQVSTCRFHGYLIQWKDKMEWPAVLCLQEQAGVTCFETNLRYR